MPCTHEAIAMGPTCNIQGSYKFLSLETGRKIVRRRWTELPMPGNIIEKGNKMGIDDDDQRIKFLSQYKTECKFDEDESTKIVHVEGKTNCTTANLPGIELEETCREIEDEEI